MCVISLITFLAGEEHHDEDEEGEHHDEDGKLSFQHKDWIESIVGD